MALEQKQSQSIFPDLPRQLPVIDETGDFNSLWSLGLSSLFQALQHNWKNEGLLLPPLNQTQMNGIQDLYAGFVGGSYNNLTASLPDISGQTVYDSSTSITNQFVIAQDGGGSVTLAQWVPLSVLLTNAGNPNGTKAGVLNWLCYDTVGKALYICTTSGSTTTAAWQSL